MIQARLWLLGLAVALSACTHTQQRPFRYALLPFDNLTGDASLDWIARAAPGIAAGEVGVTAQTAASTGDAYLRNATRFVHGYFTGSTNALQLTVEVEDSISHKMVSTEQIQGPFLSCVNTLSKRLDPKAEPFSSDNEAAVEAWGHGDFENAVTLDPSFGTAWFSWMETKARSGDVAGAIELATRALQHPVKSEVDGLRIELTRANLAKDAHAEHEALVKLTARVADPRLLATLGSLEVRSREFALAEGDYKKILAVEPDNAEALNQLGYIYGFEGKVSEIEQAFERYGRQPGQEANSFDSMGEAYFMNGKFQEAEKAFLRAHELKPGLLSGGDLRKAAYAHWLAGDLPGADKIFEEYLDFRAKLKDPGLEWQHANWDYATGRKEQAIARLQKAPSQQNSVQVRVWQTPLNLRVELAQLKQLYESAPPSADGLYRTLYAEELLRSGDKEEVKKLAGRWPLPDSVGEAVLQSMVFPKYIALRRILGL